MATLKTFRVAGQVLEGEFAAVKNLEGQETGVGFVSPVTLEVGDNVTVDLETGNLKIVERDDSILYPVIFELPP